MDYYRSLLKEDKPFVLQLKNKAISKQRPRKGRSGHMFTPAETRRFEKYVAECGKTLLRSPYTCPVRVIVHIFDPVPVSYTGNKRRAAELNLINPPVGDLDNKVKAITDGLNGVAYVDDKQINKIDAGRYYAESYAIYVQITRNGLSAKELEDYGKRGSS